MLVVKLFKKKTDKDKESGETREKVFNKKNVISFLVIFLLLLIPLTMSFYFRMQPYYIPSLDKQAYNNVMNYYKSQIAKEVDSKFAYLPPEKKAQIVDEQMSLYIKENSNITKETIRQLSVSMKNQLKDADGEPYLGDIDTWMQYKYAKNYVEYGMAGDKEVDGIIYNTLRDGRNGQVESNRFHPWIMAQFHKMMTFFKPDISVMTSVFLFPVFWITLSIIPAFFIGRRLSNNFGGFIAAVIIAVHPMIMSRTTGGVADTDLQNVFFPLFIMWFAVEAYAAKKDWSRITWISLAGIFTGLYSVAWTGGWWYTFDFIFISILGFIIYKMIKEGRVFSKNAKDIFLHFKASLTILLGYLISSGIFVILMHRSFLKLAWGGSIHTFFHAFSMPLDFLRYYDVGKTTIWPNVLTTVAELNRASMDNVISSSGQGLLFILGLTGIVLVIINRESKLKTGDYLMIGASVVWYCAIYFLRNSISSTLAYMIMIALPVIAIMIYNLFNDASFKMKYSIMLLIFFAGTFFAGTMGVRFIALFAPVLGIAVGVAAGKIYDLCTIWFSEGLSINRILVNVTIAIVLMWMILPTPINSGWTTTTNEITMYNDAWDNTLRKINQTSEDGIITSWWDYGHWFVAGAERKVTFDGGSQADRIHWVGKTLLTSNETEALGVLRMLNCGQNNARYRLEEVYGEEYKAAKVLYSAIEANDRQKAESIFRESGLKEDDVQYVLKNTYCTDMIDQYYIASEDMVSKSGVWAHFGVWDFDRAYLYNRVHNSDYSQGIKILTEEYNYSKKDAEKIYDDIKSKDGDAWIAPWPSYDSRTGITPCSTEGDAIKCSNGLIYNMTQDEAFMNTNQGLVHPTSFSYLDKDGKFTVKEYNDSKIGYGVALFPNTNSKIGTKYGSIGMDPALTGSMFTRMFFFDGAGLKKFQLLSHEVGIDGTDIYLYKIYW